MKILVFATGLCLFLLACNTDTLRVEKKFENQQWLYADSIVLHPEITDTLAQYRLNLNLNLNEQYPFSNIYIQQKLSSPDDSLFEYIQTFEILNPDGTWKIKPDIFGTASIQLPLIPLFKFQKTGFWNITIKQFMREDTLKGVENACIKLEKVK